MDLDARLLAIVQAVGADVKALNLAKGDLQALPTIAKNNLVAAIAEVHAMAQGAGASINDAAGDGTVDETWSANKIFDEIAAAIAALRNELRAGAGAALDTFAEVAQALADDDTAAAALADAISKRVRFDAAQALSAAEKLQACQNIGVGNYDQDLVAAYVAAKA